MKSSRCATKSDAVCILLVADLSALLAESGARRALIRRLVSHRQPRSLDRSGFHGELATGQPLAPAPLTRWLDRPEDAQGLWMRADPVDLAPDLGAVWLQSGARIDPASGPGRELRDLLADEGLELDFADDRRGYLRLDEAAECDFWPPWSLAGASLEHRLPEGPGAKRWRRLLNETQTLLHQYRSRAEQRDLPGSLWFWGPGKLPEPAPQSVRVDTVLGDDLISRALAGWLGVAGGSPSIEQAPRPGLMMTWPLDYELQAEANLDRLDAWIRRAWRRLGLDRRLRVLEIAEPGRAWTFTTADAWRVWR